MARALRLALAASATLALLGVLLAPSAQAADPSRPASKPLPSPPVEAEEDRPSLLPPIPPRRDTMSARPGAATELVVRRWRFEGQTLFSAEELRAVLAPFTDRPIGPRDLQAAVDAITLHYVSNGYFTSGARIPDQDVEDGEVRIDIVEGRLTEVDIKGNLRLRDIFVRNRLGRAGTRARALHVPRLEERIRLLQEDPRVERVDASLRPGARVGEARLELRVREANPVRGRFETDNHVSPSLGNVRGRAILQHLNVAGLGDSLTLAVGGYAAGPDVDARYEIPFTPYGTSFAIAGRWTDSELVDRLGRDLQVKGEFWNVELELRQPIYETPNLTLATGGIAALRESETELLNIEFNEVGDRTRVLAFRLYQELVFRDRHQVLAARSTTSFGASALHATRSRQDSIPSSRTVSWLGQVQWLRRFAPWDVELLLRGEIQLSEDPLLSLEQISIGGHATVRGYRENQLVRDQGAHGGVELRIPLLRGAVDRRAIVQVAPFVDAGYGWNRNRISPSPTTLYSAGLALRVAPLPWLRTELAWAERLADVDRPEGLQGDGLHFQVIVDLGSD